MTIKVTKPEINVIEKLNELKQDTGLKGQELMRADTAQEARTAIGAGRKNLIINGDFRVSQRGDYTSATALTATATYYLDRWKIYAFTNTSGTFQHKTDQELPDGTVTNTHVHTSTSSDLNAPLVQLIEDHKAVWGKHFTVSFWYKSNKETYYNIWNGTSQIHFLVPSSNGAWVKWEQTYKLKENGAYFRLEFYSHTIDMTSGSYLELAQVQVELGTVATDFEHRSYGEELALCQRYYEILGSKAVTDYGFMYIGTNWTTVNSRYGLQWTVTKRASPTITESGTWYCRNSSGSSLSVTAKTFDQPSPYGAAPYVTVASGLSVGHAAQIWGDDGQIYVDAEV